MEAEAQGAANNPELAEREPLRSGPTGNPEQPGNWSLTKPLGNVKPVCIHLLAVVTTLLIFLVIALSFILALERAKRLPELPIPAPCPGDWLGFQEKCYYFSNDTRNWTSSQNFCTSHAAGLAVIDTQKEMDLLMRYKGPADHWIGLNRESGHDWKWTSGIKFTEWFEVKGKGECAYLNDNRVSSARSYTDRRWICSKPDFYAIRRQNALKDQTQRFHYE
ncbi:C-type lectin domain family 2 member D-like isoform X1 [Ornithorhynchus anatinus]|uniref:C-type lectin domain family 2 member D-like isoform X1 n=1 Tax=Ornithorhynchus anatinus TaxID=9258 RepID=UPI0010A912FC|nr:C-type lectin domain family 2 member D-like isoform X1 [Ornithorhynchus anatinus]